MKRLLVLATIGALGVTAPAQADPITPAQATTELTNAVSATNNADSYVYFDTAMNRGGSFSRGTGQYEQDSPGMKVFNGDGTYLAIQWPSTKVKRKVTGPDYLDNAALAWEKVTSPTGFAEIPMWSDLLDPSGPRRGLIYFPPRESDISYADKTSVPGTTTYTIGNGYYEDVYTVDGSGRITRLENTRSSGTPVTGEVQTWNYVPVTVTVPPASATLPYDTVGSAIEAAQLNGILKALAVDVAGNNRGKSLKRMRVSAKERVTIYNAGGEDEQVPRFVKLKIKNISGGVRMFRKNPFTGTFHEWRITRKGGGYKAFKSAP